MTMIVQSFIYVNNEQEAELFNTSLHGALEDLLDYILNNMRIHEKPEYNTTKDEIEDKLWDGIGAEIPSKIYIPSKTGGMYIQVQERYMGM
jgi:hypothetical protein